MNLWLIDIMSTIAFLPGPRKLWHPLFKNHMFYFGFSFCDNDYSLRLRFVLWELMERDRGGDEITVVWYTCVIRAANSFCYSSPITARTFYTLITLFWGVGWGMVDKNTGALGWNIVVFWAVRASKNVKLCLFVVFDNFFVREWHARYQHVRLKTFAFLPYWYSLKSGTSHLGFPLTVRDLLFK